ncbi:MAG: DUF5723 family protein [Endomicrobiales bacterium]|nr:DUF5723 family protein [Endomicrobiales bacterium]
MKKLATLLSASLFCLALLQSGLLATENSIKIRGARALGMGGAFTAIADDQNAFFYNPAGITQRTGSLFTLFDLPLSITDDSIQFMNFYNDNQDGLKNFDKLTPAAQSDLINKINNTATKYRTRLRFGFPNTNYISKPGFISWGLGVFDQADIGIQLKQGLIVPNIDIWGNMDVILAVPLAHRFDVLPFNVPGKLSVGATIKDIMRGRIEELNKSILEFEKFDPVLQPGNGYGMDLGTLYQYNEQWNFGLQIMDLGGTSISYPKVETTKDGITTVKDAFTGVIYPVWNIGAAYVPKKIYYWPGRYINTLNRLQLAADIDDVFSSQEPLSQTFWKKTHIGAEFRFSTLALRVGFNSGYPTAGLKLGIPYLGLNLEYAYWSDELGLFAGQIPESNHQLSISFRWGNEKGKAFGSDAVVKEKKTEPIKTLTKPTTAQLSIPAVLLSTQSAVSVSNQNQVGVSVSTATVAPIIVVPAPSKVKDDAKAIIEKPATAAKEEIKEQIKKK